jgi:hypothetical protein
VASGSPEGHSGQQSRKFCRRIFSCSFFVTS